MCISPKVNVIARLEFELAYSEAAVQLVNHNSMMTTSTRFYFIFLITFFYLLVLSLYILLLHIYLQIFLTNFYVQSFLPITSPTPYFIHLLNKLTNKKLFFRKELFSQFFF